MIENLMAEGGGIIINNDMVHNLCEASNETFKKYYQEYYSVICKHITYIVGSQHIAEDITQEAFIKLYNSPPVHLNIVAWLTKVANNLAYNYLRDQNIRSNKEPIIHEYDESKVISIEDAIIKDAEIRLTKKILNTLEPRDRMCLMLKFSGYKYDEIAEIIGIEKSSVGTILARCQIKFKERYIKEVQPE